MSDIANVSADSTSFENNLTRLDQIVRLLERGDASLDEALGLFEEGAEIVRVCGRILDNAEQRVLKLSKGTSGEPESQPFDSGNSE